ncbi:MAG: pirin family protein [Actinomycetota bacterium]|nr:pirin family protein [Actinomycetota bacterium]
MPAIHVADPTALPRLPVVPGSRPRTVASLTTAPAGLEGEGFPVHRAFAGVSLAQLDPFVHMDQMGAVAYAPGEPKGTPWHPHRGFETVTYMIDGTFEHQDSIGGGGLITNGDTQWMTAGSGILHIERPPETLVASGGLFHGVQLWVNLPSAQKMTEPRYQDIAASRVALATTADAGALTRIIAGTVGGFQGPGTTHTPIAVVHLTISAGAQAEVPWPRGYNALAYVLGGRGAIGAEGRPIASGQLAVLVGGDTVVVRAAAQGTADSPDLDVLLLGGQPIGEPVVTYGPFVMNTRQQIAQAFEDYQAGRLGKVPAAHIGR